MMSKTSNTCQVSFLFGPSFTLHHHSTAWKPTFIDIQFGPFHLLHGSQGRLQCNPSAAPLPTFQWFRNGVLIFYGGNSRYELEQDGTLVIKKVDRELDAVNFTCRAENYLGADSASSIAAVFGMISSSQSFFV